MSSNDKPTDFVNKYLNMIIFEGSPLKFKQFCFQTFKNSANKQGTVVYVNLLI